MLFPNVFLPLHIFELRYRAMVGSVLEEDRIIGMVLLRPGWESGYDGFPAYPVGCAGLITHAERLSDGRFNIVLQGLEKFRITGEDHSARPAGARRQHGRGRHADEDRDEMRLARRRLEALLVLRPRAAGSIRRCRRRCPTRT